MTEFRKVEVGTKIYVGRRIATVLEVGGGGTTFVVEFAGGAVGHATFASAAAALRAVA